ncbi:ribose-5-phosphate isomerase RpiA [Amphiplicatus metriothermophilus]|nr:ribose-5-phosphate isomerase RpiA [Amphiplicatus metriothermophilus]MBB5519124.1 ribose 5-phosphate isomerase A [Amphiplicatus metriothermophilus]
MSADAMKRRAAAEAMTLVADGMTLGLGTGSTAAHFIDLLGEAVRNGLSVKGVPTSEDTSRRAEAAGVELIEPDETTVIDLAVDGADEVDARGDLIKGGGGALLREKIVAAVAKRFVVIADASKKVAELGAFPLPVEIDRFAYGLTARRIREALVAQGLPGDIALRHRPDGAAFVTDGGNLVVDCRARRIHEPALLDGALKSIPGVVETGLFLRMAERVIFGTADGVEVLRPPAR